MTTVVQSVIKKISKVILKVPKKISLHVFLLIMSKERKNYASMARENNIPYRQVYIEKEDAENYTKECMQYLQELIKSKATKDKPGHLIIDFTLLEKHFAQKIPSITYDYDGTKKRVAKGFSAGFVFWSNDEMTIPFDYALWLRKKDLGELYKKKTEIAQDLILLTQKNEIPIHEVRLDGAFASVDMIKFLIQKEIHFTMRIPANRVIETKTEKNQLAKHSELQMQRNEKFKTIQASYKGFTLYFTAQKRNACNNKKEIVFIVSDIKRTPKEHVEAYNGRWPGEKYFRTAKQHIGLTHCQSTNQNKQQFHIFSIMVAYAVLQCMKIDQQKQSIEEALHPIRRQKIMANFFEYVDLELTIMS